jgi:hypothetical protein
MSAPPTWGFDRADREMRAARAAGWRRADLAWERLQERANADLAAGDAVRALRGFRRAHWLARAFLPAGDPRRATSLANAAFAARAAGAPARALRDYAEARRLWAVVPATIPSLTVAPRARSSLFHLRMEARHLETFRANQRARLARFVAEADAALAALTRGDPPPVRLASRWKGEKPAVFDDSRKLLAACLLIAGDPN